MCIQSPIFSTALLVVAAAGITSAQTARVPLQDAKNVSCEFPLMASGNWARDWGPSATSSRPATLTLGFTDVNTDEGTAENGRAGWATTIDSANRVLSGPEESIGVDATRRTVVL